MATAQTIPLVRHPAAGTDSRQLGRSAVAHDAWEAGLNAQEEQAAREPALVLNVAGDVAPKGEAIRLMIERNGQGPVDLCLRSEDLKYLVSLLLNLGCEARRRQAPAANGLPPTEAIPLPLDAIDVGQSDDDQSFMLLEVGLASLMFMLSPKYLEQIGRTMLLLSRKSSSTSS
jgi:hypothetical protein